MEGIGLVVVVYGKGGKVVKVDETGRWNGIAYLVPSIPAIVVLTFHLEQDYTLVIKLEESRAMMDLFHRQRGVRA